MSKGTILMIEDESAIAEMVVRRLEFSGYEVVVAVDGQQGLEKARELKPDLIILDLMLPKMDGHKVCGMLKADKRFSEIPIILFTAKVQQADRDIGQEVGADAYITKPFEAPVLLAKIEELIKRST